MKNEISSHHVTSRDNLASKNIRRVPVDGFPDVLAFKKQDNDWQ